MATLGNPFGDITLYKQILTTFQVNCEICQPGCEFYKDKNLGNGCFFGNTIISFFKTYIFRVALAFCRQKKI